MEGGKPHEDRGRGYSDAATTEGRLGPPKLEEARKGPPVEPSEGE